MAYLQGVGYVKLVDTILKTEDIDINGIRCGNLVNSSILRDGYFENVTKIFSAMPPHCLTFITNPKFADNLYNVSCVITTKEIAQKIPKELGLVVSDNPKLLFYAVHELLLEEEYHSYSASVTRTVIGERNVRYAVTGVDIGEKCIFEPNVVIQTGSTLGNNVYVGSFVTIGGEGFEVISTTAGNYMVMHRGKVLIGDYVNIQNNVCIDKGVFPNRPTILEDYVSLDNFVHIAHGVQVGSNTKIAASTMIAGNTTIGKNVYIGPGARISNGITIGDNARISLGSVVTKDVPAEATVTGNFAIPHEKFIENLRRVR